jgi:hypothetical protein
MSRFSYLMSGHWLEILLTANSVKDFRGFPRSLAHAELVPKFHVALHSSHGNAKISL